MRNEVRFTCPCSTIHVHAPGFNIAMWISKWSEVWAVGLCLYGNHDQWYRFSMQSGDNFCRRTETLLSVRQTRSKIQCCLLKCFQHSLIFQIIEIKNWYDVKWERDWAVKKEAVALMTKVIILSYTSYTDILDTSNNRALKVSFWRLWRTFNIRDSEFLGTWRTAGHLKIHWNVKICGLNGIATR